MHGNLLVPRYQPLLLYALVQMTSESHIYSDRADGSGMRHRPPNLDTRSRLNMDQHGFGHFVDTLFGSE